MAIAPTYLSFDKKVRRIGTVGAADTYVTGGFSLTAANLGLTVLGNVDAIPFAIGGYTGVYNQNTGKVVVTVDATGVELSNASTVLQNSTFVVNAIGS